MSIAIRIRFEVQLNFIFSEHSQVITPVELFDSEFIEFIPNTDEFRIVEIQLDCGPNEK